MSRRVTIRDVAELADVSISTVSHALSSRRPISGPTRERVLAAAEQLGYQANAVASSLRRGKTQLMGLILRPKDAIRGTKRGTDTFLQLIGAIVTTALDEGWGVVHIPNDKESFAAELPVDGYIVAHPYAQDPVLGALNRRNAPLVTIDPVDPEPSGWNIRVNYPEGVRQLINSATRSRGILFMPGTEANLWNIEARHTIEAWCATTNTPLTTLPVYEGLGQTGAIDAIRELPETARFDAIITGPSTFALGLTSLASTRTQRIASLTDSPTAAAAGITALDVRLRDAGAAAVGMLAQRLSGDSDPQPIITSPELHWRDTWRPGDPAQSTRVTPSRPVSL